MIDPKPATKALRLGRRVIHGAWAFARVVVLAMVCGIGAAAVAALVIAGLVTAVSGAAN
jgi:hypothetical protein